MNHEHQIIPPGRAVHLADYDPASRCGFSDRTDATEKLESDVARLSELQERLHASNSHALLVIFQAMDAAGKDGAIKHVMSGVNPQGVTVTSFKQPSALELEHDYLWRHAQALPERGRIAIFNRSHYEEVVVVRVHPELLRARQLVSPEPDPDSWGKRYEDIKAFEHHVVRSGTVIVKFFLHISRGEQARRLLDRIDQPNKNWKFSVSDIEERMYWDEYVHAYEQAMSHTSTRWAPWYIVPAEHKWVARLVVADVLVSTLSSLDLRYPEVEAQQQARLAEARTVLQRSLEKRQ
jgi:PPK2 family polyphosphate:nucleotide phosphotransferase